jgi:hypothetical protein
MSFEAHVTEDRRLVMLRLLAEDTDYSVNSSLLQSGVGLFGHSVSRDLVHTDLTWLAEQGLVTTEQVGSVLVATLTQRGLDVAEGRVRVPGIKRPGPR